ncbi:MAG: hypothetical protein M3442_12760, partial [Chloroflexota bacterium]|nr:hypothetical protein [Chloroflexota bacterium]
MFPRPRRSLTGPVRTRGLAVVLLYAGVAFLSSVLFAVVWERTPVGRSVADLAGLRPLPQAGEASGDESDSAEDGVALDESAPIGQRTSDTAPGQLSLANILPGLAAGPLRPLIPSIPGPVALSLPSLPRPPARRFGRSDQVAVPALPAASAGTAGEALGAPGRSPAQALEALEASSTNTPPALAITPSGSAPAISLTPASPGPGTGLPPTLRSISDQATTDQGDAALPAGPRRQLFAPVPPPALSATPGSSPASGSQPDSSSPVDSAAPSSAVVIVSTAVSTTPAAPTPPDSTSSGALGSATPLQIPSLSVEQPLGQPEPLDQPLTSPLEASVTWAQQVSEGARTAGTDGTERPTAGQQVVPGGAGSRHDNLRGRFLPPSLGPQGSTAPVAPPIPQESPAAHGPSAPEPSTMRPSRSAAIDKTDEEADETPLAVASAPPIDHIGQGAEAAAGSSARSMGDGGRRAELTGKIGAAPVDAATATGDVAGQVTAGPPGAGRPEGSASGSLASQDRSPATGAGRPQEATQTAAARSAETGQTQPGTDAKGSLTRTDEAKPSLQRGTLAPAQTDTKADSKPVSPASVAPAVKTDAKAEPKSDAQTETKAASAVAVPSVAKSEAQADTKTDVKQGVIGQTDTRQVSAAATPAAKADAKTDDKTDTKAASLAPSPVSKADAKVEVKGEAKAVTVQSPGRPAGATGSQPSTGTTGTDAARVEPGKTEPGKTEPGKTEPGKT